MDKFVDKRDGETYKIVKIGSLLWFAENLRYLGISHCFPNRDSDNVPEYGCLYTWENAKLACPPDWRLPTKDEFLELINALNYLNWANSSAVRDKSWNDFSPNNNTGFSAVPAGGKFNPGSNSYRFGRDAYFWAATPYAFSASYYLGVNPNYAMVGDSHINHALSVRCVKEI